MNSQIIKKLVSEQINSAIAFENLHGITKENLSTFLVEPYSVLVDPDDLETEEREMWVTIQPQDELLIAFDPLKESWAVIEPLNNDKFLQVVSGETLAEALDGM